MTEKQQILNELNLLEKNFNINDIDNLQDLLYIIYLNYNVLNFEDQDINIIIKRLINKIYNNKLPNMNILLRKYISTRILGD